MILIYVNIIQFNHVGLTKMVFKKDKATLYLI